MCRPAEGVREADRQIDKVFRQSPDFDDARLASQQRLPCRGVDFAGKNHGIGPAAERDLDQFFGAMSRHACQSQHDDITVGRKLQDHAFDSHFEKRIDKARGATDVAYENGSDDFKQIRNVPEMLMSREDGHMGTFQQPNGGIYAQVATAWLDWHLKGNPAARAKFQGDSCGFCQDKNWTIERKGD